MIAIGALLILFVNSTLALSATGEMKRILVTGKCACGHAAWLLTRWGNVRWHCLLNQTHTNHHLFSSKLNDYIIPGANSGIGLALTKQLERTMGVTFILVHATRRGAQKR